MAFDRHVMKVLTKMEGKFALGIPTDCKTIDRWKEGSVGLGLEEVLFGEAPVPLKTIESVGTPLPIKGNYISIAYTDKNEKKFGAITGDTANLKKFEKNLLLILLHKKPVYVKHPAMVGGVAQNSKWEEGRVFFFKDKSGGEKIAVLKENVTIVNIFLDGIEGMDIEEREIQGGLKRVLNIKHQNNGSVYNSLIMGSAKIQNPLMRYIKSHLESKGVVSKSSSLLTATGIELTPQEEQTLVALYSSVSPFEVYSILKMEVDNVEKIYEKLIEKELLKLVRIRKDVELTPKGRAVVNQKMRTKDEENPLF